MGASLNKTLPRNGTPFRGKVYRRPPIPSRVSPVGFLLPGTEFQQQEPAERRCSPDVESPPCIKRNAGRQKQQGRYRQVEDTQPVSGSEAPQRALVIDRPGESNRWDRARQRALDLASVQNRRAKEPMIPEAIHHVEREPTHKPAEQDHSGQRDRHAQKRHRGSILECVASRAQERAQDRHGEATNPKAEIVEVLLDINGDLPNLQTGLHVIHLPISPAVATFPEIPTVPCSDIDHRGAACAKTHLRSIASIPTQEPAGRPGRVQLQRSSSPRVCVFHGNVTLLQIAGMADSLGFIECVAFKVTKDSIEPDFQARVATGLRPAAGSTLLRSINLVFLIDFYRV